jgi:hypothetical protein
MKAFPYQHKNPTSGLTTESEGMTLRDYFAAKAMQGVIAATPAQIQIEEPHLAKWSYKMADAMLKAREA